MIQQHFMRSRSVREKLDDDYAGIELATGLIITIVIILAIFFISTLNGRYLFYLLLLGFIILILCALAITWVQQQKRHLRMNQISSPLSSHDMYVYGIRFDSLNPDQAR